MRNREEEEEFNPAPMQDSSGRSSESTEGGIADHQPFTAGLLPGTQNPKSSNGRNAEQLRRGNQNGRTFNREDPEAALIKSPAKRGHGPQKMNKTAKTILYSDKSETSVEDLMDDTPSNYNI